MFALLLLLQPLPAVATTPHQREEPPVVHVDLIIINQYNRIAKNHTGKRIPSTVWYTSFWKVHMMPPWGVCRVPVFEHRGWCKTKPPVNCDNGFAVMVPRHLIIAPQMIYIVTDYDFEYRNRKWYRPITP